MVEWLGFVKCFSKMKIILPEFVESSLIMKRMKNIWNTAQIKNYNEILKIQEKLHKNENVTIILRKHE